MNRPGRGDDGLLVVHQQVAGLGRLAHHVEDDVVILEIEVEIDLHAALVRVAGHGIPVAARLQHRHAHG